MCFAKLVYIVNLFSPIMGLSMTLESEEKENDDIEILCTIKATEFYKFPLYFRLQKEGMSIVDATITTKSKIDNAPIAITILENSDIGNISWSKTIADDELELNISLLQRSGNQSIGHYSCEANNSLVNVVKQIRIDIRIIPIDIGMFYNDQSLLHRI